MMNLIGSSILAFVGDIVLLMIGVFVGVCIMCMMFISRESAQR